MDKNLPKDLFKAEEMLQNTAIKLIRNNITRYISLNLLIGNIRLNPIVERLANRLLENDFRCYIIWADEGGSALGKRDMPNYSKNIYSFKSLINNINSIDPNNIILAVSPQPYDFDEFQELSNKLKNTIIMINGKLEDTSVGIGTVGRERRKYFINLWKKAFWLQPINNGAILRINNENWDVFRLDSDGYRFAESFKDKPDEEQILSTIASNNI